ncbi:FolC bifunctional protein [Pterulicium gracile]|uniref:Folylpolyglutamate synthase n=1 Tax=Pterulicium gracile TaxID=1884261 RepID=A0A5C3QX44_9AGAR|nr:FolC bifunctional protein [Pterula gracilis]
MLKALSSYLRNPAFSSSYRTFCRSHLHIMAAPRTYSNAIELLNSLQSNAATLEAVRASGGRLSEFAIPEMVEYLERIGYTQADLNAMNVLHITGTKGKGSTSAFADSILRHVRPDWKVGLYTSPHLVAVRERIRVNGAPISEDDFARFFFEVWDKLEANDKRKHASTSAKPMYFRFVTLVAFHAFLSLKVDATVLEVGVGGAYDSTNIVPKPITTGVTALGIDHTAVLGKTIEEIAWQKGGIYKEGVPALTVPQPDSPLQVLNKQAKDLKASEFIVVDEIPGLSQIKLGLAGDHQVQNANLAVHLTRRFVEIKSPGSFPTDESLSKIVREALEKTRWPGRCQTVVDPAHKGLTWYLDGSHTLDSLACCMQWFVHPDTALSRPKARRVLIFNCTNGRSGHSFLQCMLDSSTKYLKAHSPEGSVSASTLFDEVVFCANVTYSSGSFKSDLTTNAIAEDDLAELKTQHQLALAWGSLHPEFPFDSIHVLTSIEDAVKVVQRTRASHEEVQVLVAGSLHLVGGLIEVAGLSDVAL